MTDFRHIGFKRLRQTLMLLKAYVTAVSKGKQRYSKWTMRRYNKKINDRFEDAIKHKRREFKIAGERYGVSKRKIKQVMEYAERNIITTFQRNADRAFGQAAHSIERALGEQLSAPGAFGIWGLLQYMKKRPKLREEAKVEGFSRLTRTGRLFTINLIDYLLMLVRTAQVEWSRQVNQALAYIAAADLVRIDSHPCWLGPNADEVCNRWRDRIVSLSGLTAGFPKLTDATSEQPPLFHPNCSHSMHPLTPREERFAITNKIMFYATLRKQMA